MKVIFALVLIFFCSPALAGKLYKCTGDDGVTVFSDTPCAASAEELKGVYLSNTGDEYDDEAVANCVDYLNRAGRITDPEGIKVHSHRYEWVIVQDIGARRMLHLMVNVRNEYGAYDGAEPMQCLMMGDGQTVNSNEYKLVE